ncbi:hypothetical protein AC249_AIPGENE17267 [Exaiptasia diaphana]|nr:hypothetical protein AC249_AIPGENE17267 [Exaiptasia diaphana]
MYKAFHANIRDAGRAFRQGLQQEENGGDSSDSDSNLGLAGEEPPPQADPINVIEDDASDEVPGAVDNGENDGNEPEAGVDGAPDALDLRQPAAAGQEMPEGLLAAAMEEFPDLLQPVVMDVDGPDEPNEQVIVDDDDEETLNDTDPHIRLNISGAVITDAGSRHIENACYYIDDIDQTIAEECTGLVETETVAVPQYFTYDRVLRLSQFTPDEGVYILYPVIPQPNVEHLTLDQQMVLSGSFREIDTPQGMRRLRNEFQGAVQEAREALNRSIRRSLLYEEGTQNGTRNLVYHDAILPSKTMESIAVRDRQILIEQQDQEYEAALQQDRARNNINEEDHQNAAEPQTNNRNEEDHQNAAEPQTDEEPGQTLPPEPTEGAWFIRIRHPTQGQLTRAVHPTDTCEVLYQAARATYPERNFVLVWDGRVIGREDIVEETLENRVNVFMRVHAQTE